MNIIDKMDEAVRYTEYLTSEERLRLEELESKSFAKRLISVILFFTIIMVSINISGWFLLMLMVLSSLKYKIFDKSELYEEEYLNSKGKFLQHKKI